MPAPESPSISIITAVRNGAATIARALESIASQSEPPDEHIIVDGLSSDATLDVVARYRNERTRVTSEADSGIYDAFNKGVCQASQEVIGFLNADDAYSTSSALSAVRQVFRSADVDAVFGDVQFVRPENPLRVVRRFRSASFRPARLRMGFMPAHPALFLKRSVFERFGLFDTSYRIAGDFEFVARTFGKGRIRYAYLPQTLVTMHTGGISTRGPNSTAEISREILRASRANGIRTNALLVWCRLAFKLRELLPVRSVRARVAEP